MFFVLEEGEDQIQFYLVIRRAKNPDEFNEGGTYLNFFQQKIHSHDFKNVGSQVRFRIFMFYDVPNYWLNFLSFL
jgi:hypothetical protein